jgi:hypothetical protein
MTLEVRTATRLVQMVLACINQEYPHNRIYWLDGDEDLQPPRKLTPVFYGCLDWHSAVHGHWRLVRLCRYFPAAEFQTAARQALEQSLTADKIEVEVAHLKRYPTFECPYGLVWLLQLAQELREWDDAQAQTWLSRLAPLEAQVAANFQRWLQQLLTPDRTGTHGQTAFGLGLGLDWAKHYPDPVCAELIAAKARQFYLQDCPYPLQIEPLAYDFLSPGLATADLLRRILTPQEFANWLTEFLPQLHTPDALFCLKPVAVGNPQHYHQAHFRGLNLSRAWMLAGILSHLPEHDPRRETLHALAKRHRQQGLAQVDQTHYASSHWLGTFAVYLLTERGLEVATS